MFTMTLEGVLAAMELAASQGNKVYLRQLEDRLLPAAGARTIFDLKDAVYDRLVALRKQADDTVRRKRLERE